jgi:hypothetical protein
MSDFRQFSEESIRKIQRDHSRLKALSESIAAQQQVERRESDVVRTVTGYTSTNSANPTYPTTGDTYVVKLKDYYFQEQAGTRAQTATGEFSKSIIARTWDGSKLEEDTPVICDLIHCVGRGYRWWIRPIPAAATTGPEIWTQVVSATGVNTWWFWQYGAGARDTDDVQLTANGVYCFPRFGIGTYSNANGAVFALRTTPTAYNDTAITFSQKAFFALHITTIWRLPSLSSSVWNVNFKDNLTHNHDVTVPAGGTTYGTTNAVLEAVKRDSLRGVTVLTTVNGVNAGYSTIPYFYTAADGDSERYATHTRQLPIDRSSSQTGLTIVVKRLSETIDDLGSPVLIGMSLHMQQCSNILG